jgi:hypothetical protein
MTSDNRRPPGDGATPEGDETNELESAAQYVRAQDLIEDMRADRRRIRALRTMRVCAPPRRCCMRRRWRVARSIRVLPHAFSSGWKLSVSRSRQTPPRTLLRQ